MFFILRNSKCNSRGKRRFQREGVQEYLCCKDNRGKKQKKRLKAALPVFNHIFNAAGKIPVVHSYFIR